MTLAARHLPPASFALAAAAYVAAIGIISVLLGTYRGADCWQGPVSTGCAPFALGFADALVQQPLAVAGPFLRYAVLVALCVLSALAIRSGARAEAAIATGAFAVAVVPELTLMDPWPVVGLALLVVALEIRPRDAVGSMVIAVGAIVTAVGVAMSFTTLYGGPPITTDMLYLAYVSTALMLGCAAGALAHVYGRRLPFTRGLGTVVGVMGLAGLFAGSVLFLRFYPEGAYVNPGIGGLWFSVGVTGVLNLALMPVGLRLGLSMDWDVSVMAGLSMLGLPFAVFVSFWLASPLLG